MHQILNNTLIEKIENTCWTPVKTKARCEKKLAAYCEGNNLPYYLPLIRSAKRQKRQNLVFYIPMFSGYVFCALNDENFRKIANSNTVVHKLRMDEISEKILIEELNAIKKMEEQSDEFEIIVKPEIVEGKKVKVSSGPLQGLIGVVAKRQKKAMISVNLELLGQSVSAEIDLEHLELEND